MKYYSALKNEGNSAICDNIDEPRRPCAKGNKRDAERQVLCGLT